MSALVAGLFCAVGGTGALLYADRRLRRARIAEARSRDLLAVAVAAEIVVDEASSRLAAMAEQIQAETVKAQSVLNEQAAHLAVAVTWGISKRERSRA